MSIKTILSDKSKFPDDLKLNVNGIEVSVGELRQADVEFSAKQAELVKAQQETATFYANVLEYEKQLKQTPTNTTVAQPQGNGQPYNYEADALLGPMFKDLKAAAEAAKADAKQAMDLAKKQQEEFNKTASYYFNDKWKRDYELLPADARKDLSLQKLLETATKENLVDEFKVPDIRKAYDKLTEPQRLDSIKSEAEKVGYEKAKRELAMASIPRPGLNGMRTVDGEAPKVFADLDQAIAAARQDPEIVKGFAGINPADLV